MIASVSAALRLFGGLKFGTPLLTASTPVSAVQPDANARSASNTSSQPRRPAVPGVIVERRGLGHRRVARSPPGTRPSRSSRRPPR